jgi:synaptic vesicle membrane protein VAT-1
MRQVWIPRTGGPDVLEVRESDDPTPGPGEVRIRVAATGVNFADVLARMGLYPDAPAVPCVVGYEVSGTIDEVGAGVEALAPGDRVLSLTRFGGYSDVVVVPQIQVAKIGALDFEKAAAIPVNYLTAWLMLVKLGNVQGGDRVLVHAAAGGVGQAALQICQWKGATVIGTASAGKHPRLRELGVAHVVDYRNEDYETVVRERLGEVDIVLDAVGGASFRKGYRLLAPMGRMFMFGVSSFAPGKTRSMLSAVRGLIGMPSFRPLSLMNDNRGVFGINLGHLWEQAPALVGMLEAILALVHEGVLDPVVDRTFGFGEAAQAHGYLQDRKNFGKVLLVP